MGAINKIGKEINTEIKQRFKEQHNWYYKRWKSDREEKEQREI